MEICLLLFKPAKSDTFEEERWKLRNFNGIHNDASFVYYDENFEWWIEDRKYY